MIWIDFFVFECRRREYAQGDFFFFLDTAADIRTTVSQH